MTAKEMCLKLVEMREQGKITDDTEIFYPVKVDRWGETETEFEPVSEIALDSDGDIILI